jgi:hypothetical protein
MASELFDSKRGIQMDSMTRRTLLSVAATLIPVAAMGQSTSPPDALLYIIWPNNGERIKGDGFWCRFGLRNMGIARAGDMTPNAGHHHLLIDVDEPPKAGEVIPSDKTHLHFGAGQTEARIELPRGKHTLQLILGDAEHKVFNPPVMSAKITITMV